MRVRSLPVLAVSLVLFATGCGSSDPDPATGPASETQAADDAYPRTITHAYGTTTLTERPERIVTVGYTDAEYVLAFGEVPVGFTAWFADRDTGVGPWADELVGDAEPEKLSAAELEFETILSLDPDVIIGFDNVTAEAYERLSQIAPTVGPEVADQYGHDWRESVATLGEVLDEEEKATGIVESLDTRYADVAAEHPEFEGRTVTYTYGAFEGGDGFYVFPETDPRQQFLAELGFTQPGEVAEIAQSDSPIVNPEQVQLLESDVLLLQTLTPEERDRVLAQQLFTQLDVVDGGRLIDLQEIPYVVDAIALSTPLSQEYVLDQLVGPIAEAVASTG